MAMIRPVSSPWGRRRRRWPAMRRTRACRRRGWPWWAERRGGGAAARRGAFSKNAVRQNEPGRPGAWANAADRGYRGGPQMTTPCGTAWPAWIRTPRWPPATDTPTPCAGSAALCPGAFWLLSVNEGTRGVGKTRATRYKRVRWPRSAGMSGALGGSAPRVRGRAEALRWEIVGAPRPGLRRPWSGSGTPRSRTSQR